MSTFMPPAAYGAGADETAARGSYGPVIGMLALVLVLAAAAVAVGRFCFGRRGALGHDLEASVERTCGPCVGVTRATNGAAKEEEGGGSGTATALSVPAAATEQPPGGTTAERGESSSSGGGC
ncbi:hypothetical protein QOZ80_1AG0042550 [Eleusine coracana subsp. coracana]|nr:hypothetical protein QOZ80_1AG0042550 [Eleusine coracana subsp. coracana]